MVQITPKEYVRPDSIPLFSFKNFYIQYGRFHYDEKNLLLHTISIPIMMFTSFCWIQYHLEPRYYQFDFTNGFPSFSMGDHQPPNSGELKLQVNLLMLYTSLWWAVYIYTDFLIGVLSTGLQVGFFLAALRFRELDDTNNVFGGYLYWIMLVVNMLSFQGQLVGHKICEERAPAGSTNWWYAGIAQFFVTFEILHTLFGYRNKEVEECAPIIEADIAAYRLKAGIAMRQDIELKKTQ